MTLDWQQKYAPCLVLSIPYQDEDRALVSVIAHTTSPRNSRFEIPLKVRFLRPGVFDAQNLITIPRAKLLRKLGKISAKKLTSVENSVRRWLGI